MLKGTIFALPANVGNAQPALQQIVGTQFHLPLKAGDVRRHHPLEERTHRAGAIEVAHLHRIGADVSTHHSRHEQSDVTVYSLVDDVSLVIRSPIPRKRFRAMLTKIVRLARPNVAAIVIAVAALIEVELQIVGGTVEGFNQSLDVRLVRGVGQSLGIIFGGHVAFCVSC